MKTFRNLTLLTTLLLLAFTHTIFSQDDTAKGAIIIVSVEGDVKIRNVKTDALLPKEKVAAGSSFSDGHTVQTGDASKAILLLSNGSITTVNPNTDLTFAEFTQKKFEKTDQKMVELATEPSNSKTKLQLSSGSLVFDVKKLNPGSTFEIDSPVGSAGIRGTVGKIKITRLKVDPNNSPESSSGSTRSGDIDASTPGSSQSSRPSQNDANAEIEITMQEDSVEFTDTTGNTQNVDQGQQLSGSAGNFQNNPAPQEELNNIQETQQESEEQSSDVSLGDAGTASEDATEQSSEESSEEKSSEEESSEESSESSEETNTTEETTTEETTTAEEPTSNQDSTDAAEQNRQADDEVQNVQDTGGDTQLADAIEALELNVDQETRLKSYEKSLQELIAYADYTDPATGEEDIAQKQSDTQFLLDVLQEFGQEESVDILTNLFNDDLYSQNTRKNFLSTLEDPSLASNILRLSLGNSQLELMLTYNLNDITSLVDEPSARLAGILNYELSTDQISVLMGYSSELRQKFVDADDKNFVQSLLSLDQSESDVTPIIENFIEKKEIVDIVDTSDKEQDTDEEVVSEAIATLLEDTRENGNEHIVDILYEEGDGKIDATLLAIGILGNDLLTDVTISGSLFGNKRS